MAIEAAYVGILVGCGVFGSSLIVVFVLLYCGGSFDRMRHEAAGLPETPGEEKPKLYDALLHVAKKQSLKPKDVELHGHMVQLRPLDPLKDAEQLYNISNGKARGGIYTMQDFDASELIWKHLPIGPFASVEALQQYLVRSAKESDSRSFVILEAKSLLIIGTLSIFANEPEHLCCQIGRIWLTPSFHGTGASVEAVYLVLRHLFESNYRRVEWRCDGYDIRSRKTAHSLGFTFEALLRKHRISKECNVDTALFAAVNGEWIAIRDQLEKKLEKFLKKSKKVMLKSKFE